MSNINSNSYLENINKKIYTYIWLDGPNLKYYKSFIEEDDEFICPSIYNNNFLTLVQKYKHEDYINTEYYSEELIYCEIKKFDNLNKMECTITNDIVNSLKKIESDSGFNISFTININNSNKNIKIPLMFSSIIKDYVQITINNKFDYIITIEHENPLITCYYYCFIRYYLESNNYIDNYETAKNTINEIYNYRVKNNNSFASKIIKSFLNSYVNNNTSIELTTTIKAPLIKNKKK
jgi:hypothetical protein